MDNFLRVSIIMPSQALNFFNKKQLQFQGVTATVTNFLSDKAFATQLIWFCWESEDFTLTLKL